MLIGTPIHDRHYPNRRGQLRSVGRVFVTAYTPERKVVYIRIDRVRQGLRPRGTYRKARDPETLRLAEAVGLSYQEARKVRGT